LANTSQEPKRKENKIQEVTDGLKNYFHFLIMLCFFMSPSDNKNSIHLALFFLFYMHYVSVHSVGVLGVGVFGLWCAHCHANAVTL
jgi:hypothetical protein